MIPTIDTFLRELARTLAQDTAPRMPTTFEASGLIRNAMLLGVVAEEFDRAAARRVEENAALRRLFASAVDVIDASELRARLHVASGTKDASLRVSDLDISNRTLRGLLIELHAHVEQVPGEPARILEAAIWHELALSTERRRTSIGR